VHPLPETENIAPDPAVVVARGVGHKVGESDVPAGGDSVVSGTSVAGMVPIVGHEVGVSDVPDGGASVVSGTLVAASVGIGGVSSPPRAKKQIFHPRFVTEPSVLHVMVSPSLIVDGTSDAVHAFIPTNFKWSQLRSISNGDCTSNRTLFTKTVHC